MTYTIGRLHDPRHNDLHRRYIELDDARSDARELAIRDQREEIAIWDERGEVMRIFTDGMEFRPA